MAKGERDQTLEGLQVFTRFIQKETEGPGDLVDLTEEVQELLRESGLTEGSLNLFIIGSTAGLTTIEFEPGLLKDWKEVWQKLIPQGPNYAHHQTWNDGNGFSHLRASVLGPSLVIPFADKEIFLGTWQQIVLAEFDNRPRDRKIVVQMIGK